MQLFIYHYSYILIPPTGNPYASKTNNENYDYTAKKNVSFGINYYPLPQIVVKADYSCRILKSQYNNEPSINIGIAYAGFFL